MNPIAFIDIEVDPKSGKILDFGGIKSNNAQFHKASYYEFTEFLQDTKFICGHNIIRHDAKFISEILNNVKISSDGIIDTLFWSPLLFPNRPYHSLVKDDKLQTEELNNPLNDSIKARDLFYDEVLAFNGYDEDLKQIFYLLLNKYKEFSAFFKYIKYSTQEENVEDLIRKKFNQEICENAKLGTIITEHPTELAYCLSLIYSTERYSITPPWVLKNYPHVEVVMFLLRGKPCVTGCNYCHQELDIHKGLKKFFGFDAYRNYGGEPLQEKAVKAAIDNKSLIAVFPTGGGKSITFQVPALMQGENLKGLTVVISPLQSLMKDQVDNLERNGITTAVTINGLLDPIERAKSFERVEDGSASILYISPESLRSKTIEKLLLGRKIVRFVIDEAHCFSSWGQDFRVDYLYIGDFIRNLQKKKNLEGNIPISCFTATAKQKVIEDIRDYFKEKLSLDLEVYTTKASRTNLHYKVFLKNEEEEKYQTLRDLIEEKNCPTIIYVSRTHRADLLALRLENDGFNAKSYHGKMDKQRKSENQDSFIRGEAQIMVATSAFGMGVDKKDVGMVIHYEISDSLENYIQEAGRAGRDENINADCFVLFNEEDLSKHFILLNQTKLSIKEIQQVWKAIKEITKFRSTVSNSALEIARKAGWDDSVVDIETRVTTAIASLEESGYLRRGQNMPRVFANSILSKNAQEAIDKIYASEKFNEKQKEKAIRIIKKLFSSKSRKYVSEESAESRVDYISDHLGMVKEEVMKVITLLKEEKILADTKDLTAFIKKGELNNRSFNIVEEYCKIERFVFNLLDEQEKTFHLKELNEEIEKELDEYVNTAKIKTIFNFWSIKNWVKCSPLTYSKNHISTICIQPKEKLKEKLEKRHELAKFIIKYLYGKSNETVSDTEKGKEEILVEFSVHDVKTAYQDSMSLFKLEISIDDIEDTLFYLSRIEAIKIEGGFLVSYNLLTIERTETDNKKRYTKEDYQKLNQFYENKVQQIHIVGEYAKKMIHDYRDALQFVEDYFQLNYSSFLNKYFKGSRQNEIKRNITPEKFRQLFGELSPTQLKIINDNESKHIVVAAGPGSGKTRILVHKLASLLLMEDVKHEQLLMLTFSRSAATEFKKRLLKLIGNASYFIDIKTFHSYCFDLLGKVGNLEKSEHIIENAIEKIKNGEVEISRITKTVLVIDEAQDMNKEEYQLVRTLMEYNEDLRVIAVGDDDQNIYEFRGASSSYLEDMMVRDKAVKYELVENYRSKSNLVEFTNYFVKQISHRLKDTSNLSTQSVNGKIKIVHHQSSHLIEPVVYDVLNSELVGSTCILTKTNEEALQITGRLLKNQVKAKLIQTNDSFNLYDLKEIRYFISKLNLKEDVFNIDDEIWKQAKKDLKYQLTQSNKLEICLHLIRDFELINVKRKFVSDLKIYLFESKLEDFIRESGDTIYVSTIHKSKGKEFDNVFILLENFKLSTDTEKRQLFVAMTRAKNNLTLHLNSYFLNTISVPQLEFIDDFRMYDKPKEIILHLNHKDVNLGYFEFVQHRIKDMFCGQLLKVSSEGCCNENGEQVLKFSKKFLEVIKANDAKGYVMKDAKINFMVYWFKEEIEKEILIILPELNFEKNI